MSYSITGIPTTRVSDMFVRQQMLSRVQFDQGLMLRLQTQLSTGHRFETASDDPLAAIRVMGLQSLMERKDQVRSNLSITKSYLSQTDSALGAAGDLTSNIRALALEGIGDTATDQQRQALAQQVNEAISQLMDTGNQKLNGRYLFAGSLTSTQPFSKSSNGYVQYLGDSQQISTYADIDQLTATNVTGDQAFGTISSQVQGINVQPALTYDTLLADLHHGTGVMPGSVTISDGHSSSQIDLTSAATLGDAAALIRANPPDKRQLEVEVTGAGLRIVLMPDPANGFPASQDNLSVREVNGGSTAADLGILRSGGVGPGPLVGDSLDPAVRPTTSIHDILGTHAQGFVRVNGQNNDMIFEAAARGTQLTDGTLLNGLEIRFLNDLPMGDPVQVDFDPGQKATPTDPGLPGSITIHLRLGETTSQQVIEAVNNTCDLPFSARLDPTDRNQNVAQPIMILPANVTTGGGGGTEFDQTSGLRIYNNDKVFTVDFTNCETVEDMLNAITASGADVLAEIPADGSGINVRSRLSGSDFMIGENGGATATQLGLRTFTTETRLADLNFGRGVNHFSEGGGPYDFTISQPDQGINFGVDLEGIETVGALCDRINELATDAGSTIRAQLAEFGNGIQLVDEDLTHGTITVSRDPSSTAAYDLGLVSRGQQSSSGQPPSVSSARIGWAQNSGLAITGKQAGSYGNVRVLFVNNPALSQGDEVATYDSVAKTLTFQIAPQQTTANDIIAAIANNPEADAAFSVALDTTTDPTNDGTGLVVAGSVTATGGQWQSLVGTDVNPQETRGLFTALLRLREGLKANNVQEIQRAVGMLDDGTLQLNLTRADVGTREQGIALMDDRISSEQIDIKSVTSDEWDADLAEVITNLTGQQTAYEASLRAAGQILQMSLLDYL